MSSKRRQKNQEIEQSLQIARWSQKDVEKYLLKKKFPIGIYGAFRMKWNIDGDQLLDLTPPKIERICAGASPSMTRDVIAAITALQTRYDRAVELERLSRRRKRGHKSSQKNAKKDGVREPPPKRRRRQNSQNAQKARSQSTALHDISCSGERWDECTLREAWFWYLPPHRKSFEQIANLLRRTRVAVLSRINLIRRAIHEHPELAEELKNPLWKSSFSLRQIVSAQAKEEKLKYQEERIRRNKEALPEGYAAVERADSESEDTVPAEERGEEQERREIDQLVHELLRSRCYSKNELRNLVAQRLGIDAVKMKVYYKTVVDEARDSFYSDDEEEYFR